MIFKIKHPFGLIKPLIKKFSDSFLMPNNQDKYLYFSARYLPTISVASIYGNSAQSQNRYVFSLIL